MSTIAGDTPARSFPAKYQTLPTPGHPRGTSHRVWSFKNTQALILEGESPSAAVPWAVCQPPPARLHSVPAVDDESSGLEQLSSQPVPCS